MSVTAAESDVDGQIDLNNGATVVNYPEKFWPDWRWDPDKYFENRKAMWTGTVMVGNAETIHKSTPGADSTSSQ